MYFLATSMTLTSITRSVFTEYPSFPTGASALIIPPDAVFPCDVGDMEGLHKRDKILDELHQRILRFIYAYAPGADAYITEE